MLEFLRGKFRQQTITQEQAVQDDLEGLTKDQKRHRMRGRWYTYQARALGNRKLGMALVTYGFDVDLRRLAIAYATASEKGDASSLPQEGLRERVLSMRSYHRWGRKLYNDLWSGTVAWESLGPSARNAWRWYYRQGWCVYEQSF